MPSVTLTLTDTPNGGVALHHNFHPRVGAPCSKAQEFALEIINRTHRQRGLPVTAGDGVDIDAVHRTHQAAPVGDSTSS